MKLHARTALLILSSVLAAAVLGACGKGRLPTEPPLPQPTPNATLDAVVRGKVTMAVPTATGDRMRPTNTVFVVAQRSDGSLEMRAAAGHTPEPSVGRPTVAARPSAGTGAGGTASGGATSGSTSDRNSAAARITPTPVRLTATSAPPTQVAERLNPTAIAAPAIRATTVATPDGRAIPVTPVVGSVNAVVGPRHTLPTPAGSR